MRVLISADWQADFGNLDQCELAKQEVFAIAKNHEIALVIIAGDAKQQYNPIDTRVAKFWVLFIKDANKRGLEVHFLLGNHDRVGQYTDAQNWLPILEAAGAKTFDKSVPFSLYDDFWLYYLPYMSSINALKESAKVLGEHAERNSRSRKLLLFHCDIATVQYSLVSKKQSDVAFSVEALLPELYDHCIGGHIHLAQEIPTKAKAASVHYVGSPFACDWGEANQKKRYLLYDTATRELTSIRSKIPGWYDKDVAGYKPPDSWEGCRLRMHVPVSAQSNYTKILDKAQHKAEEKYKGVLITVLPRFEEEQKATDLTFGLSDSDVVKVQAYVKSTLPEGLQKNEEQIVSYLTHRLAKVGKAVRTSSKVEFIDAKCKNMLSYEELFVDYKQKGIVVVQGQHKNWPGRSNGAGKSNFLAPIPIALHGKTFKGQKFNEWARDKNEDPATVKLRFRDDKGRLIKVIRGQRPSKLKLLVNGVDESSGMKSTQKNGTRALVAQLSGFTWETLANAVYIDHTVVNAFLAGTTKARAEVLAKILNIERFDLAQKQVSKAYRKVIKETDEVMMRQDEVVRRIKDDEATLRTLQKDVQVQLDVAKEKLDKARRIFAKVEKQHAAFATELETRRTKLSKRVEVQNAIIVDCDTKLANLKTLAGVLVETIANGKLLAEKGKCPTCTQFVDVGSFKQFLTEKRVKAKELANQIDMLRTVRNAAFEKSALFEGEYDKLAMDIAQSERSISKYSIATDTAFDAYEELKQAVAKDTLSTKKLKARITKSEKESVILFQLASCLEDDKQFLDYCSSALSRDGIPLFLSKQLCPVLNKAASFYSEIFSENEIQIRFSIADGEFLPQIVNLHGGDATNAQSVGERALAGLITSFALREVAPLCNILVLDEPGAGLDPVNAKQFAKGLRKLTSHFETIFVVTHNPFIYGELSGEKTITIVKKDGISSVQ